MERPLYINWLVNEEGVTFEDGVALKCYKLSYETDEAVFDDWALHIRKHYVEDDELTDDSVATGLSIEDYLREYIIPQRQETFGPTARSNDISEILFADLFEFILNYEVPRCKPVSYTHLSLHSLKRYVKNDKLNVCAAIDTE